MVVQRKILRNTPPGNKAEFLVLNQVVHIVPTML